MKDEFLSISAPAEGLYSEKGSKFLAFLFPVSDEDEASVYLASIKKLHPKARHYCTALRLVAPIFVERFSDDGEPSGTAGRPIMGQLIKNELQNVMAIVVRYFGGTKLGVPGLIEAYRSATEDAVAKAQIITRTICLQVRLTMSYEIISSFKNVLAKNEIRIFEEKFEEKVELVIGLKKSSAKEILQKVLHDFSQRDFHEMEMYGEFLSMKIEWLKEERIV